MNYLKQGDGQVDGIEKALLDILKEKTKIFPEMLRL